MGGPHCPLASTEGLCFRTTPAFWCVFRDDLGKSFCFSLVLLPLDWLSAGACQELGAGTAGESRGAPCPPPHRGVVGVIAPGDRGWPSLSHAAVCWVSGLLPLSGGALGVGNGGLRGPRDCPQQGSMVCATSGWTRLGPGAGSPSSPRTVSAAGSPRRDEGTFPRKSLA